MRDVSGLPPETGFFGLAKSTTYEKSLLSSPRARSMQQSEDAWIPTAELGQLSGSQEVLNILDLGFLTEVDEFSEVCAVQSSRSHQQVGQKFLDCRNVRRFGFRCTGTKKECNSGFLEVDR